jgi:GH25 family lysozyme M1 (1,4-beta-N-acetylmuramidase)
MALGVDLYDRYQDVADWWAVRRHGVTFVYLKGTDGGGPATVRADAFVRGATSVGLPIGLYHYAQLAPPPETQADMLVAEVRRLGATGLPPALDLEGPFHTAPLPTAVSFAKRFLDRVRAHGYRWVTLYANTSFLGRLQPDSWGIPGLVVWAASYGINDGTRHRYSYPGRVDIHQYTDVGRVPGISGSVDLNESLTNVLDANPEEDILAALNDAEQRELLDGIRKLLALKPGVPLPNRSVNIRGGFTLSDGTKGDDHFGQSMNGAAEAADGRAAAEAALSVVRQLAADVAALSAKVDELAARPGVPGGGATAAEVVSEFALRLAE